MKRRIRLELPADAAKRLQEGFDARDPALQQILDEFGVTAIATPSPEEPPPAPKPYQLPAWAVPDVPTLPCELCGRDVLGGSFCEECRAYLSCF